MDREKLVVVGGGMASARLVERLSAEAPGRYSITMIGEEPRLAYNRVLLSSVLAGDVSIDDIDLKPSRFWKESGVEFLAGQKVTRIDRGRRRLSLQGGRHIPYSRLVIATGSRAIRLPIDGACLRGVHTFRDIDDVGALTRLAMSKRHVLVIGGGLLGLEAAYGLARLGTQVTLAHVLDRLMERQLDAPGADVLRRIVEQKAIRVLLNANAVAIRGEGHVQRVDFDDGRSIDVDAVVFAVGVRPNAELAQEAGLTVNRGVIVDDGLTTGDPNIFAIGECAEHRGVCYGLVEPAYEQGRVLAMRLAGEEATYDGSVVSTNLKVSGVRVFSAGDFMGGAHTRQVLYRDPAMGVYRKLVLQDDNLKGAILIGNTTGALDLLELIRSGANIAANTDDLMFGAPIARAA